MVVQETLPPGEGSRPAGKHEKKHRLKQRFEVVKKLGQGTYGKVQLAVNKETSQEVAIKTIKKSKIESEQDLIRIRREIQIMSSIQHPHIIHIYEVFENKDKIVLVMQYASGGELYDYLSEKKMLSDTEARQIFRQVAAAVYYCHKNKICHRDLKLENVLLDEKGNAKIADFGLSNVYDEKHLLDTFCGSPLYASPEIVKGVPYYGPEVDCWSMGVILYTLVYGAMPFDGSNFKRLVKQISEGDYYEPAKKAEASQLIHRLLHVNPAKRATIIDICTDSWVNEGYEHTLLQVSEDLANLTPVRIDLLLALAPASPAVNEEKDMPHPLSEDNNDKRCAKLPEEQDDDTETATDSFAYLEGGTESHRSASFPNLPNLDSVMDGDEEFLPAAVAAELEGQYAKRQAEKSFDGGLAKTSSIVHKTKKPRKSSVDNAQSTENAEASTKKENISSEAEKDQNNNDNISKSDVETVQPHKKQDEENKVVKEKTKEESKAIESNDNEKSAEINKTTKRRPSTEFNKTNKEKVSAPGGRMPGKITIPKFLESPETSPTKTPEKKFPSPQAPESIIAQSEPKLETHTQNAKSGIDASKPKSTSAEEKQEKSPKVADNIEDIKNTEKQEEKDKNADSAENKETNSEDKKCTAKGILKKNIAKARLLEKRLSQQSSVESETGPASPPSSQSQVSPTSDSPDVSKGPSFFKVPQPYSKTIKDKPVESKAEIVFTSNQEQEKSLVSSQSSREETESIWGTPLSPPVRGDVNNKCVPKHVGWNNALPDFKNDADGWKQQVEESLLRLSPQEEDDFPSGKQIGPTPISRSYKKFTFTKEGTCITETGKIYTKPGADGSWTKVEKKTKITTLPGNDEFQKFEHVQVRDESNLSRSDSQSSSGSNDIFDDIFDSWTGDSMMCNFMKVKDNIKRFSRGPLLWRERQRDPFKQFYNAQTNARETVKHSERCSNQSSEWESSDNEEFEDMQPVVYGSQGLWQLMRSVNKDLPHHLRSFRDTPRLGNYTRSISRDRGTAMGKQSYYTTRPSSGYNTRSLSRERSQSPKETLLRFVVESPQRQQSTTTADSPSPSVQELWHSKVSTPSAAERRCRKDSGVESCASSDSEATRQLPSRMSSRDEETGYTSFDGTYGPRTYRQYIKSFSKPSERQRSLEEPYAQSPFDNLTDSRRHRVEQWLHMADVDGFDSPFEEIARQHDLLAQYENPGSSIYGTMRPRGFMKYSRSMSDKMNDPDNPSATTLENKVQVDQDSEEQTKSYRSEINVENMGKVQSSAYKTANYSTDRISSHPIGGSSYRLQQCDSAELAAKHQNASNQPNASNNVRYTRSYSGNLQYAGPQDKGQNRPILSMTVSFNRGGAEGPVVVQSNTSRLPGYTGGVWQQQEFSSPGKVTIRREFSDPSSESAHANVSHRIYSVGGENVSGYSFQETDRCPASGFGQGRADGPIPIRVYTTKTTRLN